MSIRAFFNRVVSRYRTVPWQSNAEMGLGLSIFLLISLTFDSLPILLWTGVSLGLSWAVFYFAAFIVALRGQREEDDRRYDRNGKYRFSREYWDAEGPAAMKEKKAKTDRRSR